MDINFEKFKKQALKKWLKLDKYDLIMKTVKKYKEGMKIDNHEKEEFQKTYIAYYDMFRKTTEWKEAFFIYFENCLKKDKIGIEEILDKLAELDKEFDKDKIPKVELSFASKLLATIDPKMPVWDSNVAQKLGEKICQQESGILIKRNSGYIINGDELKIKLKKAKKLYPILINIESEKIKEYEEEINKFKEYFNDEFDLSEEKILDFFLWKLK